MITYSCDICGDVCASVQHVDRYQLSLDLCAEHLEAWISHAEAILADPTAHAPEVQHGLSRAYMDAIYMAQGAKGKLVDGVPTPAFTPQQALEELRHQVNVFKAKYEGRKAMGLKVAPEQPGQPV